MWAVVFLTIFAFNFGSIVHFWKWVLGNLVFWFLMILVNIFLFLRRLLLEMIFNCGDAFCFLIGLVGGFV